MRSVRAIALTAALTCVAAPAAPARADDRAAVTALNAPMKSVQDESKSWRMVFEACAAMTAPPVKAEELDALAVWPGMQGWDQVKAWAAANGPVREALMNAQKRRVFGAPYGRGSVPPAMVEKGLYVGIGDGVKVSVAEPRYLRVLDLMTGYVTAEMYRLGEEGKFDEAFDLGIATLRVLRQVADQHLLEEKSWALSEMCDLCSVQRDVLQTFLDKVPAATLKRVAKSGYPMVHPSDSERLRRLEMPEGDRVLAEAMLLQLFDSRGQPDSSKFASTMGDLQAREEPLGAFGAARRWQSIAQVHGSLDLTRKALTTITDRDEDAAAGVRTIAVLLGRRNTAIFSAAWFVLVGLGAASIAGSPLAFAVALPYLSLSLIGRDATGEAGRRLYRLFLITNVLIGASITMLVLLQVPFESAVAAGAVAIVGTLIALGASVGRSALRARRTA